MIRGSQMGTVTTRTVHNTDLGRRKSATKLEGDAAGAPGKRRVRTSRGDPTQDHHQDGRWKHEKGIRNPCACSERMVRTDFSAYKQCACGAPLLGTNLPLLQIRHPPLHGLPAAAISQPCRPAPALPAVRGAFWSSKALSREKVRSYHFLAGSPLESQIERQQELRPPTPPLFGVKLSRRGRNRRVTSQGLVVHHHLHRGSSDKGQALEGPDDGEELLVANRPPLLASSQTLRHERHRQPRTILLLKEGRPHPTV